MPDTTPLRTIPLPDTAWSALPVLEPPRSAWPAIEAALRQRERRRGRRRALLAVAAALAMLALLPRALQTPLPSSEPASQADAVDAARPLESTEITAWMTESAQLEALVAWGHGDGVETATAASLGAMLQERIQHVDLLLARADADPEALLPLWQERVLRLRQLAALQNSQHLLAANGQADPGTPVFAF